MYSFSSYRFVKLLSILRILILKLLNALQFLAYLLYFPFPYNIFEPQVIFTFIYSSLPIFTLWFLLLLFSNCVCIVLSMYFNPFVIYFVSCPNGKIK